MPGPGVSRKKSPRGSTPAFADHSGEVVVHFGLVRQLRVKGSDEDRALAGHHALVPVVSQRRHRRTHPPDAGCPNEHHLERSPPRTEVPLADRLEGLLLATVRIALRSDIDESERELGGTLDVPGEQDQPGAGAEDGLARRVELLERRHELPRVEQLEKGRALSPGHDEAGHLVELTGHPHLGRVDADPVERLPVEGEVSLEREHADLHANCTSLSGERMGRARSASYSRISSAFRSGGNTGYQTCSIRPPSTYQAIRLISVFPPPLATGYSKVGSPSARVKIRSASLRISNGKWRRSTASR